MKKIYIENFHVDMKHINNPLEFAFFFEVFISVVAQTRSIKYPSIVSVYLYNDTENINFMFVYPQLDRSIPYEIFFQGEFKHKTVYIQVSYTK